MRIMRCGGGDGVGEGVRCRGCGMERVGWRVWMEWVCDGEGVGWRGWG